MATTTPNYGWDVPTSTDYVKDGATAIETLGDDIDSTLFTALGGAYPGLRLVKKQTIGTAVSSVTVTGAFSATYENYKIVFSNVDVSSSNGATFLKFNNSAGSTYSYCTFYTPYSGTAGTEKGLATNSGINVAFTDQDNNTNAFIEVAHPFLAVTTNVSALGSNSTYAVTANGIDTNAVSQTGFSISVVGRTMTGGTIYVYGYGAS
jgi:hypothetical protein